MNHPTIGVTPIYGQPPNTDLPRNGFLSQGDHSGLHILDVEKHAWSEQTLTGTPPEKVGCTGGTLGCWLPQRRCQKISHPAWLIWDLGWHYSMLVCYSMASCHKEHLTHEAVWGSSFGLPHNTNYVSRMRSKGSRFTLGVWRSGGWGCVRSTLRLWSQPSATVRAIPIWPCLW